MNPTTNLTEADQESIRTTVREGYSKIATGETKSCCGPTCCNGGSSDADPAAQLAAAVGYSDEELSALPDGANLGLSCGNPTAIAALQSGETVVDLGSGGGFDVFIAARKVGPGGRAIGVDMTAEMIARARRNVAAFREAGGADNVEFRLGEIEHLPLGDATADVVISNCVINLSPDKPQVWREIARVLKPGGRVAVSDIALRRALPAGVREMIEALVGCLAGASLIDDIQRMATAAGLVDIQLEEKPGYVEAMVDQNNELYRTLIAALPAGAKASDYAVSLNINARKPNPQIS